MKPLAGLPVDTLVRVADASGITLNKLHELGQQLENGISPAFLSRYRADLCGGLDEQGIQKVLRKLRIAQDLHDRRIALRATLTQRGAMTEDLGQRIDEASDRRELGDILLAHRLGVRDKAQLAADRGLDPLARVLWFQDESVDIEAEAAKWVDAENGVADAEQALAGARDIAARWLSEKPEILRELRQLYLRDCEISVSLLPRAAEDPRWRSLDGYRSLLVEIPWERRLQMRRGIRSWMIKVDIHTPSEAVTRHLRRCLIKDEASVFAPHLDQVVKAALGNGLSNRVKSDVLQQIDERVDRQAIEAFSSNLRRALLAPPARGLRILGIDMSRPTVWQAALIEPDGRVKVKAAVRAEPGDLPVKDAPASEPAAERAEAEVPAPDSTGDAAAKPVPVGAEGKASGRAPAQARPSNSTTASARRKPAALQNLAEVLRDHEIDLIVYAPPARSRSAEQFLREHIRRSGKLDLPRMPLRQTGAVRPVQNGRRRDHRNATEYRRPSAVSLARRVRDPLAELVRLDPRTARIGANHQEVGEAELIAALQETVRRAVHDVGVDVNQADVALLERVPGLNSRRASLVVKHRKEHGPFATRRDVSKVTGLEHSAYLEAVGFLRVYGGDPFDETGGHPDYRELYESIAEAVGCELSDLLTDPQRAEGVDLESFATEGRPVECVRAAIAELRAERRNPRGTFEMPKQRVPLRRMDDLEPGKQVTGVVRSVTDFGVFVDVGLDKDALLHVSQMLKEHVKDSKPTLRAGAEVSAYVRVSPQHDKISLSMWEPNSRPRRDGNNFQRGQGAFSGDSGWRDGPRRRNGRGRSGPGRSREPFRRTFGPVEGKRPRERRGRNKMTRAEMLESLQDRYRTKV